MATILDKKEAHPDRMLLSVGPHHPATHGVLRVILELEGEIITDAEPEIGFLHTGIEKNAEALNWQQANTVIDRMDYLSPISNNTGYCMAVEKLLGITDQIPDRANKVRVILLELQRIASHMVYLGTGGIDLGATTPFFWAFDIREAILDILEETTGARMNPSYIRVGGLAKDIPDHFKEIVEKFLKEAPKKISELRDIIVGNPIVIQRLKGVGKLTQQQALELGLTGHNLRASGSDYDVRKYFPYLGYENYDFKVPVYHGGDMYDRVLMRFDECFESMKIVRQALDNLSDDGYVINNRKLVLPPKHEVKENMEALIHHFKLVQHGFDVPAGEVYQALESPRGEIGFYVVSSGDNKPWRVRVRPPSFYAVNALPEMIRGHFVADMVTIIAGADPIFGEVDR